MYCILDIFYARVIIISEINRLQRSPLRWVTVCFWTCLAPCSMARAEVQPLWACLISVRSITWSIINSKFIKHYSKAKHGAPAYSWAMHRVGGNSRDVEGRSKSGWQREDDDILIGLIRHVWQAALVVSRLFCIVWVCWLPPPWVCRWAKYVPHWSQSCALLQLPWPPWCSELYSADNIQTYLYCLTSEANATGVTMQRATLTPCWDRLDAYRNPFIIMIG